MCVCVCGVCVNILLIYSLYWFITLHIDNLISDNGVYVCVYVCVCVKYFISLLFYYPITAYTYFLQDICTT